MPRYRGGDDALKLSDVTFIEAVSSTATSARRS